MPQRDAGDPLGALLGMSGARDASERIPHGGSAAPGSRSQQRRHIAEHLANARRKRVGVLAMLGRMLQFAQARRQGVSPQIPRGTLHAMRVRRRRGTVPGAQRGIHRIQRLRHRIEKVVQELCKDLTQILLEFRQCLVIQRLDRRVHGQIVRRRGGAAVPP